jgi:hypothetical protein
LTWRNAGPLQLLGVVSMIYTQNERFVYRLLDTAFKLSMRLITLALRRQEFNETQLCLLVTIL